jgi:hypothetical protein
MNDLMMSGPKVKIVRISNCHCWDGLTMLDKDFDKLINLLHLSTRVHIVEIVLGGTPYTTTIKGNGVNQ